MAAEGVLHLLEDDAGDFQRMAGHADAVHDPPKQRRRDFAHQRVAEQLQQTRHADDERRLVVFQRLHDGFRRHVQRKDGRRVDGHRHDHRGHQRIGVVQRQDDHDAVVRNEDFDLRGAGLRVRTEVLERQHDAFRRSRRAGRVDDHGQFVVGAFADAFGVFALRRVAIRQRLQSHDGRMRRFHQRKCLVRLFLRLRIAPDDRRRAIVQNVRHFLRRGHEIDRHDRRMDVPDRIEREHPFGRIRADDGDAVAAFAELRHLLACTTDHADELSVADAAVAADKRRFVGV